MRKRFIVLTAVLALTVTTVAGCGSAQVTTEDQPQAQESTQAESTEAATAEEAKEETTQIANPWVDITEEEANEKCLRLFKAPEGATVQGWSMCEDLGDPDKGIGPLIQLSFELDGNNYTARAQQGAAEDADIAGNYVEWTVGPEEVTLANWGGGNMKGKTYRSINNAGYLDMITWYDEEIGIAYSLSVGAADLDGFDIQAIAEQMYAGENEVFGEGPTDFVQEQSGITSFGTYDDVIAALKPGQGYAYIKLQGSDEDVLAVTDLVFEADHSAYEASLYGKTDGKVTQLMTVTGNGSSYPLRLADGILYAGDNHDYETYFISSEYGSLMQKDYVNDGVNSGTNEITGFTREKNTFEDTTDFTGSKEDFEKLLTERESKPVIEFTVVE